MTSLQELITRGRFIFSTAPSRLQVFEAVNGKRNTKEIAGTLGRHPNNVRRDLRLIEDVGLIQPVVHDGQPLTKDRSLVYERVPLARAIPSRYFQEPARLPRITALPVVVNKSSKATATSPDPLPVPSEAEVLDIARSGESQLYEFKGQGTDVRGITREIGALLNTRNGGIVLYGIDDHGTIEGSDVSGQAFDQPLQNSIRNSISPAPTVGMDIVDVLGSEVIIVIVSPWGRQHVYQTNGKILIRKGTNVFTASPEEVRKLHGGEYVI